MARLPNEIILTVNNKVIELEALKAEVAGMIADNEQRKLSGCVYMNYGEDSFICIAAKMRALKDKSLKEEIYSIIHKVVAFYTTTPYLKEADVAKLDVICTDLRKVCE